MSKRRLTVDVSGQEHLEVWKSISWYGGQYEASNFGRIRRGDRILHQRLHHTRSYAVVDLYVNGRGRETLVHRLVLLAFQGEPAPDHEGRHLNGNRTDNRMENLAWGTHKENCADQQRHGTHPNAVKTSCKRGHPFDEANTYITARGTRTCRECKRQYERKNWRKYRNKA